MSRTIGIDFGTTKSVAAVLLAGKVHLIPTGAGDQTRPSVVSYSPAGEIQVNDMSPLQAKVPPAGVVSSIKRLMGRRCNGFNAQYLAIGDSLESGPAGEVRLRLTANGPMYRPEEIAAQILARVKQDAEAYLDGPVHRAVMTVPAYFNDRQRQATRDAGCIAGLEVVRLLNDPTAAALAARPDQFASQPIMVVDLGGGTYDVSILEFDQNTIIVRATHGDANLGGDDWDGVIVNWLLEELERFQGLDLRTDRRVLARLRVLAEQAKIALSKHPEVAVDLAQLGPHVAGLQPRRVHLKRAEFETRSADLLARLEIPFQAVLQDAGLSASQIGQVLMPGGGTRMPMVRARIQAWSGARLLQDGNHEQRVAIGAALQAAASDGQIELARFQDVTPLSLGVETAGDEMTVLIPRNTTLPVHQTRVFSTAEHHQAGVDIHVLQGEAPQASQNISLGRFRLDGLPAAPQGQLQIEVCFDLDANGILSVSARDLISGQQQQVTILAASSLGSAEIETLPHRNQDPGQAQQAPD